MSVMDEVMMTGIVFSEARDEADAESVALYIEAEQAVAAMNAYSSQPEPEALDSFIELLYIADQQYIEVAEHAPEPETEPVLDWEAVAYALEESQQILVMVQEMMSSILMEMGIPDYDAIRVYADEYGWLRLVSDHDRRAEIESVLNSAEHNQLREYYMSATAGLSMAGSLVGTMAVPPEVVEQAANRRYAKAG